MAGGLWRPPTWSDDEIAWMAGADTLDTLIDLGLETNPDRTLNNLTAMRDNLLLEMGPVPPKLAPLNVFFDRMMTACEWLQDRPDTYRPDACRAAHGGYTLERARLVAERGEEVPIPTPDPTTQTPSP